jgi:hypothetical protein
MTTDQIKLKPRRRWLQFSLRTLLVLMLMISVPLGVLASKIRKAREQRIVVQKIQELDGMAIHCGQLEPREKWPPRIPLWLRKTLGDDFFRTINYVHLRGPKVTDAELVRLRALPQLRSLYLRGSRVTDAGLVHVCGLPHLRTLSLNSTGVTDAGLVCLRGLTSLKSLSLAETHVTATGVAELQQALPNCKITR